ncbi:NUDIX domain-containing protein [Rickettsiales bacterium LUAb2]
MEKRLVVTAILLNDNNEILVEEHSKKLEYTGMLQFAGGKVEEGEILSEALSRELKEELGIIVDKVNLIPITFTEYINNDKHFIIFYYSCRIWSGNIKNVEQQNIRFISLDKLLNSQILPFNQAIVDMLPKIIKNL